MTRSVLPADTHVHTAFCRHAVGTMEEYVLAALEVGLDALTFLEHMEEGIQTRKRTWLTEVDFDRYFTIGRELQQRYRGKIDIGLGVECGYNPDYKNTLRQRLERRRWDSIGLSCHFVRPYGKTDGEHINLLSRHPDSIRQAQAAGPDQLYTTCLNNLQEGIRLLPVTKVCHLDAPLRYLVDFAPSDSHHQQIESLFREMAARNIKLEVNTSGIDIRNMPFPSERILRMAQKAGLRFEFGSDAHHPKEVGRHFQHLSRWLP